MRPRTAFATVVALAWVALAAAGNAYGQEPGDVEVVLEQHRIVVDEHGKERVDNAQESRPGEVIEYVATYRNKGKSVARAVLGTIPVPAGMHYMNKSNGPKPMLASLDRAVFRVPPLKRVVRQPDGSERTVDVPPDEYQALRWNLGDLPPGKSVSVSARMQLNATASPTPPAAERRP